MNSRTYTGENSLKHWIQLMLKGNIVLPEYQRSFVWNEDDVERLILSLKNGQFVQPVTIVRMNSAGNEGNYILDGQQRLTSILLFVLGYFPIRESFIADFSVASEDDSAIDSAEQDVNKNLPMGWTFQACLDKSSAHNTLEGIKGKLSGDSKYKKLIFQNQDLKMFDKKMEDFLENRYLGFSYLVPENASKEDEQTFFSTLFRNMNYLGRKLLPMESRRSLYYLHDSFHDFFDGKIDENSNIFSGLRILEYFAPRNLDLVRYLSLLSQYLVTKDERKVMVGYSAYSSRESFYVDYVSYLLGLEQEDRKNKFDGFDFKATLEKDWKARFSVIAQTINSLKEKMGLDPKYGAFQSWIDADYWLFGIIYWILFQGKEIEIRDTLINKIAKSIKDNRSNDYYVANSNRLGNIRARLKESIECFGKYTKNP